MLARSIALASANAHASGLAHRVKFSIRDVRDPQLIGRYDLVTAFECVHDMSQPAALKAMRQLAAPAGVALSRARAAQEASGAREVRPREARSAPSADRCIRVKGDALSQFAGACASRPVMRAAMSKGSGRKEVRVPFRTRELVRRIECSTISTV